MTDLSELGGCADPETYELLRELASGVPADQAIVEIGTYRGKSACYLADGAQAGEGAHVWTFDPHDLPGERFPTSRANKGTLDYTRPSIREAAHRQVREAGHEDHVTLVRSFSIDAAVNWSGPPIGLLFIDGDHRQSAVRLDFRMWQPHLALHAVVVFDDYADSHPGVPLAVGGLVQKGALTILEQRGRVAVAGAVRQ